MPGARRDQEPRSNRLADEQAALRLVATMVARDCSPNEVFAKVTEELSRLLGADLMVRTVRFEPDGTATTLAAQGIPKDLIPRGANAPRPGGGVLDQVFHTGRPRRVDDYAPVTGQLGVALREEGICSAAAAPIVVDERTWGAMAVASQKALPPGTEDRVAQFTELVSTAISNIESRAKVERLAAEQSALRRVATLVAQGVSSDELFGAFAGEVGPLFGADYTGIIRYEPEPTFVTTMATWAAVGEHPPAPTRFGTAPGDPTAMVADTGKPARVDDWANVPGPIAEFVRRELGVKSSVGSPIVVNGSLWGALAVHSKRGPLAPDTESRLLEFSELVATAIASTSARAEVSRLAEEQAALRRVATLVARGAHPDEVLLAVSEEIGQLFGTAQAGVVRFESDGSELVMVGVSEAVTALSLGSRWESEESLGVETAYRTGRPARSKSSAFELPSGPLTEALAAVGIVSTVIAPIVVGGSVWGFLAVGGVDEQLPADAEGRLENFAELVATAIADAESRGELAASEERAHNLAREQDALRRVATLIARSATAEEVLSAVTAGIEEVFGVQLVAINRFDGDEMLLLSSTGIPSFPAGSRWPLHEASFAASVYRTAAPVRIDDFTDAEGLDAVAGDGGVKSAVAAPIVVDGNVWGSINVASTGDESFPADTEERLARFTDLLATSVSNATMRGELAASRVRVIAAADESRRRIERDLHDGAQQQLVTLAVALHRAEAKIPSGLDDVRADVSRVAEGLTDALQELREISRGIHPAILSEGGLSPALKALARRSDIRVKLDLGFERRLPNQVEVAVYYIVSEALTNTSKHADASRLRVSLDEHEGTLHLLVQDDGAGGADPSRGSGLIGLRDRVEALGGTIEIESPPGSGTRIEVRLPASPHSG